MAAKAVAKQQLDLPSHGIGSLQEFRQAQCLKELQRKFEQRHQLLKSAIKKSEQALLQDPWSPEMMPGIPLKFNHLLDR